MEIRLSKVQYKKKSNTHTKFLMWNLFLKLGFLFRKVIVCYKNLKLKSNKEPCQDSSIGKKEKGWGRNGKKE